MNKKRFLILIFLLISIICYSESIDYSSYNYFLSNVVVNGKVNYEKAGNLALHNQLKNFLEYAGAIKLNTLSSRQRLALLINIYNAATINLILENYPVNSILEIDNPWSTETSVVQGTLVTLDYLEKVIIFKEYNDARIHFLLNCSAISCPPLLQYALTEDNIEDNLESSAYIFINNSTFNKYEIVANTSFFRKSDQELEIFLSEIFSWYENDFINYFGSIKEGLIRYLNKSEYIEFLNNNNYEISYITYDWDLNKY